MSLRLRICVKKGPPQAGLSILANLVDWLDDWGYVVCTWAFFALSSLKIDLLVFIECCVAGGLNFRVVDEQVIAAVIRTNKTISLVCIEPFYCTCTHFYCSLACL